MLWASAPPPEKKLDRRLTRADIECILEMNAGAGRKGNCHGMGAWQWVKEVRR